MQKGAQVSVSHMVLDDQCQLTDHMRPGETRRHDTGHTAIMTELSERTITQKVGMSRMKDRVTSSFTWGLKYHLNRHMHQARWEDCRGPKTHLTHGGSGGRSQR